jgi:hypothetical protein
VEHRGRSRAQSEEYSNLIRPLFFLLDFFSLIFPPRFCLLDFASRTTRVAALMSPPSSYPADLLLPCGITGVAATAAVGNSWLLAQTGKIHRRMCSSPTWEQPAAGTEDQYLYQVLHARTAYYIHGGSISLSGIAGSLITPVLVFWT